MPTEVIPRTELAVSDNVRVMFRPSVAYASLAQADESTGRNCLRRPLFLAFFLGCIVSLITAQRLTLRLVAAGTLNMSFIPLVEILAVYVVWRRHRMLPFFRALDLFFMGHGPWILLLLGYGSVWAFATPQHAIRWTLPNHISPILVLAFIWSAVIDHFFFRRVLGSGRGRDALDLLFERLMAWALGILIFGFSPIPAHLAKVLHR